jgi:hypothetical protein
MARDLKDETNVELIVVQGQFALREHRKKMGIAFPDRS